MADIQSIIKTQNDWQQTINGNFQNLNKALTSLPDGTVQYTHNVAQLINGATCDGSGLYSVKFKNMTLNIFNIIGLSVPKSAINNNTIIIDFPDGTFGSRVRFNVDQATNLDISNNKGKIATIEKFDNGLSELNGEFVWFADNH